MENPDRTVHWGKDRELVICWWRAELQPLWPSPRVYVERVCVCVEGIFVYVWPPLGRKRRVLRTLK